MRQPVPLPILQSPTDDQRDTSRPIMLVGFQNQGNLGLGYLTSALRKYGYSVQVVDIEDGIKDGLIRISVTDKDPRRAAEMANAYVEEYKKFSATIAVTVKATIETTGNENATP